MNIHANVTTETGLLPIQALYHDSFRQGMK
ncbi:Uncharacterised protein [Yersinia pekkanenii]|uniref:Uncharacterized protein n=1 Tax=Yersinia pekkanenii TaxID=1288385 RepID=A0A0T9NKC5_9GAMM|nr:Uncharacterised protein [Yersinia pekkanenii]CRY65648.1 Uncharacterised protein [Yersinia pekkanenii]